MEKAKNAGVAIYVDDFLNMEISSGVTLRDAVNNIIEKYDNILPDKYRYNEQSIFEDLKQIYGHEYAMLKAYELSRSKQNGMTFQEYNNITIEQLMHHISSIYTLDEYKNYFIKDDYPEKTEFISELLERSDENIAPDHTFKTSEERFEELVKITKENSYDPKELIKAITVGFLNDEGCIKDRIIIVEVPPTPPYVDLPIINVNDYLPPPPVVDDPVIDYEDDPPPHKPPTPPVVDLPKIEVEPEPDKPKRNERPRVPGKKVSPKTSDDMTILLNMGIMGIAVLAIRKLREENIK